MKACRKLLRDEEHPQCDPGLNRLGRQALNNERWS